MDSDGIFSCSDLMPTETSSSLQLCADYDGAKLQLPCMAAPSKSSSANDCSLKCPSVILSSTTSTITSGLIDQNCRIPQFSPPLAPNINYELAVAKSIMQQYSTISGDNLFDHLSDIIKRVIDERPPNVIDFFEEFSRNVRQQKLHLPERFPPDKVYEQNHFYKLAKQQLSSMNLPNEDEENLGNEIEEISEEEHNKITDFKMEPKDENPAMFCLFYERVQYLQFFWNQCGFSISSEDIFQLACAMTRLKNHPAIRYCRFWGMINGLKSSYYIVEAYLSNEEIQSRVLQFEKKIRENQDKLDEQTPTASHIGTELTPGAMGWENYPTEELLKMKPNAAAVPLLKNEQSFDIPAEPIGQGINRYSYFVVNSLSQEWFELPICTPKQIQVSRKIKKFFTGDLEAEIVSHPCFPGKEKHYLRAMISRITAGTYIAPKGYYRKMTGKEKHLFKGMEEYDSEEQALEEDESVISEVEEGEEQVDNDIVLLKNEDYKSQPLDSLKNNSQWLHVRPNILAQGRVQWFDQEKAKRENELKRWKAQKKLEGKHSDENLEVETEIDEHEIDESFDEEESITDTSAREIGPNILTPCSQDHNDDIAQPWVSRCTSNYSNNNERILVMRSNIWPGSYTFVFEEFCESIYLGWGHKYVARNMPWQHMPAIAEEFSHEANDFIETLDPSVDMEEAYRLSLLRKVSKGTEIDEQLSDYDEDESDESSDDDEDEETEKEEMK